ncbi:MAG: sulfurtransferase [Candidatus Thiodiazotropha sp. (ex. Lucinisca nassula)]|nr:sulfurtransferase [Candidatus Thiodiazotropha sp. (ex. Lucinisca nassula)]PUB86318.1 MAG: sulfurtransferase [gamma proteobacterium symbiont of Ctena orbiculata]PUB90490.1 MAG: sulfurtransferase [gamma proteobacterium symbiont of Ctena orbiculata]
MKSTLLSLLMAIGLSISPFAWANPDYLVDADWLAEHIDDDNLVVLEVRYHPHRYHSVGHIPGAIQVKRFKDLADNQSLTVTRFPSREQFQQTLRNWGVTMDSTLVIYDDTRTVTSARLWVLLKLYGFPMEQVKVLNGGTIAWSAFEEITQEPTGAREPSNIELAPADRSMFVEFPEVYDYVAEGKTSDIVLIDARPTDRFAGGSHHGVAEGHIPGAMNIISMDGTDGQSQTWRSDEFLADMYKSVPKDKTVYVYCDDGFRMSLAYQQLTHLGFQDVRLYNGGWSHWGNWLDLPTVTGDKPFAGDFEL